MSGGYFALLGGRTGTGRPLVIADDDPAAAAVAVLSAALWRARFGGDPLCRRTVGSMAGRRPSLASLSRLSPESPIARRISGCRSVLRDSVAGHRARAFTVNVFGRLPATKTRGESEGEVGSIAAALQEGRGLVDPVAGSSPPTPG